MVIIIDVALRMVLIYEITKVGSIRLHLHDAIYRQDSFVLMLRYCAPLKAIKYKSTSFNRIVANKLHRVIAA